MLEKVAVPALALLIGAALPAAAQEPGDLLRSSFALWGMMDATANFCWKQADFQVSVMEAHQNWLARNVVIRDELDVALAASGLPGTLAAEGETYGSTGILEILNGAENKDEACATWRAQTDLGTYDAEVFLAAQLGVLRERDGL